MKGKFVKLMSLSINRETKNLASPSSCLVIELKQHFAKFALSVEGQGLLSREERMLQLAK